jgi:type II secretory pathway predicted ATPase ExeA
MLETINHYVAEDNQKQPPYNNKEYWQPHGLNQPPFEESSPYAMYYPLAQWQNHLAFLNQLPTSTDSLVMITGPIGSGKTMLLTQYQAQQDNTILTCLVKGHIATRLPAIVSNMSSVFTLPTMDYAVGTEEQLNTLINALHEKQKHLVLLIDNAQHLPLETLSSIIQLALMQKTLYLHIILTGEPQLESRVKNLLEIHGQAISVPHLELKPLTLEETKGYLRHRLNKAGLTKRMPFNELTIMRIHRLSGGLPARINTVARQCMLESLQEQPQRVDAANSFLHLAQIIKDYKYPLLIALCGVILIAILYDSYSTKPKVTFIEKPVAHAQIKPMGTSIAYPVTSSIHKVPVNILPVSENSVATTPVRANVKPVVRQTAAVNSVPAVVATPVSTNVPAKNKATAQQRIKPVVGNPQPSTVATKPVYTSTEQQLLAAQGFTLQLMGSHNIEDLQHFIKKYALTNTQYFHTLYNHQDWYVLVTGNYATSAQAKEAMKQLPVAIKDYKPWVRPLSSVHQAIQVGSSTKQAN